MSRRFPPSDAFVDESIRGQRYLMGCVLIEARHLTRVRQSTAALVAPGKRLQFHEELDSMRRSALELFATLPVRVTVVVCTRRHGVSEFHARDACLAEIVRLLQESSVPRLTIGFVHSHRQECNGSLLPLPLGGVPIDARASFERSATCRPLPRIRSCPGFR